MKNTTKEQRKQQAIKFLEKLNIYDGFIKDFKREDTVCYFENYMGYWAFQDKELLDKIKKIEEKCFQKKEEPLCFLKN